jgi:ribose-phosphate pyrophosphokinase
MSGLAPGCDLVVFAPGETRGFGMRIAAALERPLAGIEERRFDDGEHMLRPTQGVHGHDVYVVQSLYAEPGCGVDEKLVRLLFFLGALRDAGCGRLTAVLPYLCYARQDRRALPQAPLPTRYVAALIESSGADAVMTIDVHNLSAYQNAFRIRTEHLEARWLLVEQVAAQLGDAPVAVVSPDAGGLRRADAFREALAARLGRPVGWGIVEKHREEAGLRGGLFVGDVAGRDVVLVDDLLSSGETLRRAIAACVGHGARRVFGSVTHGLFTGEGASVLRTPGLAALSVTDSVALPAAVGEGLPQGRLEVVGIAGLFAEAIRRLHEGRSLSALLEGPAQAA